MTGLLQMVEEYRFWITIGFGGSVVVILGIYLIITVRKSAARKNSTARARRKPGGKPGDKPGEFMNVDSKGMPLDDNDDGQYRDSNLYGAKGKKKDKEEFYKDWD